MSNFNINNTLAELEDNLKKMDSARNQVLGLNDLVKELSEAYSNTLVELRKIQGSIHYDEEFFKDKFGKSIKTLEKNLSALESKVIDNNNSLNDLQEKASENFISNLGKSEEKVKKYIDDVKPTLEKVHKVFELENQELINSLKLKVNELFTISNQKIEEIKSLNLFKELEKIEITLTELDQKNTVIQTELKLIQDSQNLISEILNGENNSIKSELREHSKKSDNNFKITLGLIIFCFIVLVILKFI